MKASPLRLLMLLVLMAFAFGWIGNLRQLIFFSDPSLVYPKPIYANPFYIGKASGADFGQVYLGAKAWLSGENPYQPSSADFRDPIARIPAYPPLVFFVYLPLAKLSFSLALAIHLFLENFIFLVLLFLFSGRDAFFSVLAAVTLTPLGVTFLQQGQFDLYTASCFFLLGITGQGVMEEKRRAGKYFLAGLFAALKWTALPLLLFSVAWDFFLRRTRVSLFALLPVALSLLLPFTRDYLGVIWFWERQMPAGLSFHHLSPLLGLPEWGLLACFLMMFMAALVKGRKGGDFYSLFSALSLFALGLGKMAFEYRALAILGVLASGERHRFAYWIALVMLIGLRIGPLGNVDETFYAGFYFLSAITLFSAALLQKKKNENYG